MRTLAVAAAIGIWTLGLVAQDSLNTASVSGRVLDADTLDPVAGVRVGSSEIGYVVTDSEGRYRLRGLKPGRVSFSIPSGETSNPWPDKVVTVLPGREISAVDFRYRLSAQISGRVLDEDGTPIPGIYVLALTREYGPDGEMRYRVAGPSPRMATNDGGRYSINLGLYAGRSYWLLAYRLRKYANPISETPIDTSLGRRVLAATFYPSSDSMSTSVPIVLRSTETRVADIRMLRKPAYCLEATLMAGTAPAQMKFMLSEEDRYGAEFRGLPNTQEGGTSGADGRIRLCDLPPGRYSLAAFSAASTPSTVPAYFNTVPITIVDRDVLDTIVYTLPLTTVSGEVAWDRAPSDPVLSRSLVRVSLDPTPTLPVPRIEVRIPSSFEFSAIPSLRYDLRVNVQPTANSGTPPSFPIYVKAVSVGTEDILRKTYIPGGEKLRITLGHDGGVIRSRVVDANGQPSIHSAVIVSPASVQSESELATAMVEGLTNDDGVFETRSLSPGRYFVIATDNPPPYATIGPGGRLEIQRSPEALTRLLRARFRGQSVEVGPRATVLVNLTVRTLE